MPTDLEMFLYKIIASWLETHEIGNACKEAVAKKLAQRIETRLQRANMTTTDGKKILLPEKG